MTLILMAVTAFVLYLLQGMIYEKYWSSGLSADVKFQEEAAVCGEQACLKEAIVNLKFLPLSILRVKFKVGRDLVFITGENVTVTDYTYRNDVFSIFPYQKIIRTLTFFCQKRGYYTIDHLELVSHDLFFSKLMIDKIPLSSCFYVYPSEADLQKLNVPFQKMLGTLISRNQLCRDPFEFQTIREYGPCDSMKDVNWKATARTGELKVNVQESTASQKVFLLLNLEQGYALKSEAEEEEGIRICGSLLRAFTGMGIPTGILSNGRDQLSQEAILLRAGADGSHVTQALETLSRIDTHLLVEPFHLFLEREEESMAREDALYVMISSCLREETQAAFEVYARLSPGSAWIAPLAGKEPLPAAVCKSVEILRWEVPYDKI